MVAFRSSPNKIPLCTTTVWTSRLSQRPAVVCFVVILARQGQGLCMCFLGLLAHGFLMTFSCHLHTSPVIWVFEEADNEHLVGSNVYSVALFASFPEAERLCLWAEDRLLHCAAEMKRRRSFLSSSARHWRQRTALSERPTVLGVWARQL